MSKLLYLLLISAYAYAQGPVKSIRKDSIPEERQRFSPDLNESSRMPTARPNNSFYRTPKDGPNIVRATLDNMPISVPDSSTTYTMPGARRYPNGPIEPPGLYPKTVPHITPKKH
ncbi:hypothetical protein [Spirosoma radiotolerans]|uniref:Uncharacterized protein n=1 Tax=Spirosoma radiotolerans TaxID=1379870 RepID=A0A0E3ZUY6_9BACT|nr:hypothetical protein [Spirosoma radiotolerans]AKD55823.1 hypothetical protein SD10_13850 [Spirosoma radiotolerans]